MCAALRMKDKLFLACAVSNQLLLQSSLQALCPHTEQAAHPASHAEQDAERGTLLRGCQD